MFGEAHDRVDFLAECGESEHANRASGASSMLESAGTSTSRISELLRRLAGSRNGLVRLFAASSTMRELRRVTVNANGLLVAFMPKSCCSMRNAPGLRLAMRRLIGRGHRPR